MTGSPGGTGAPPPPRQLPPRPRARIKPVVAAAVIASPLLALLLLDAAALLQAFVDPPSTCWLKPLIESGRRHLYPFEIHLLYFTATIQFWAPIMMLAVVLFWYLEWIRVRELAIVVLLFAAGLYLVGVEFGWMVELYRGQYQRACG